MNTKEPIELQARWYLLVYNRETITYSHHWWKKRKPKQAEKLRQALNDQRHEIAAMSEVEKKAELVKVQGLLFEKLGNESDSKSERVA